MRNKVSEMIRDKWQSMSPDAQAVLWVICERSNQSQWVTQDQIAATEKWLGHHPVHEEQVGKKKQSTLRQVRQIVRDIRIEYGIPVISGRAGYKLPETNEEARAYLIDLEREAKAQAAAWYRTYKAMSQALSLQSSFFEQQREFYETE